MIRENNSKNEKDNEKTFTHVNNLHMRKRQIQGNKHKPSTMRDLEHQKCVRDKIQKVSV